MKWTILLPTTTPSKFIEVSLKYNLGGMSYFTYKNETRGYWVHVRTVTIERNERYTTRSFTVFQGYKNLVKEVKRQSRKAAQEAQNLVGDKTEPGKTDGFSPTVQSMIYKVLGEEGLILAEASSIMYA